MRKIIYVIEQRRPLLAAFRSWLEAVLPQVAQKSVIAKIIRYALKRWKALVRYCDEGALAIDNNPVKRTLRGVALGRRNFLFVGNDAGGERAAAIYTLIKTVLCRVPNYAEGPRFQ